MDDKPIAVPEQPIASIDQSGWRGGLDLNEPQNVGIDSITYGKDIERDVNGYIMPRRVLTPFLPDTIETTYQKMPITWQGATYYFTLDAGKVRYCQELDTDWEDCGGDNIFITNNGGKPKLLRVLDCILILNGKNGDKLAYVDLNTPTFEIVKYTAVDDPTVAPTATLTNLTTGAFKIYFAYNYSGSIGQTNLSPILEQSINIVRDQWQQQTTPGSIKLTFPAAPAGAKFRNIYIAISATGGTIQVEDMLSLVQRQNLAELNFVDDGSLDINLGDVAPTDNSTEGYRVNQGIIEDGNPILFEDDDHPEQIHIGGGGPYAMEFTTSSGGYTAEPEKGTNYTPRVLIGFRTGQGQPALTVLYDNAEGISKQSTLEQKTVNYGDQSFQVWSVTEQHYGAAGVSASNSAINYNGKLLFFSTDGIMGMDTEASKQNVLSTKSITARRIDQYIRQIKNSAMPNIIGAGWGNKFMWLVPNAGFDKPQQILISDDNNGGSFDILDIPGDWIGVVSPVGAAAFIYISSGKKSYKLAEGNSTYDMIDGVPTPFSTRAVGALAPMGGKAHNIWQADVQVMFNVLGIVGDVILGVTYRNESGKLKTKKRLYHGPSFTPSGAGGWGDSEWSYSNLPTWGQSTVMDISGAAVQKEDKRIPVLVDDIMNEAQWFIQTDIGYNDYKLKAVSFEGINLGVKPDL